LFKSIAVRVNAITYYDDLVDLVFTSFGDNRCTYSSTSIK
jgi:hypothetical protein